MAQVAIKQTALDRAIENRDKAKAALAAWDATNGAKLARLEEEKRATAATSDLANEAHDRESRNALVRLRVYLSPKSDGDDVHPDLIAAVEAAVGWPWADRRRLIADNNPRHDPMLDVVRTLRDHLLKHDPAVQRAAQDARTASDIRYKASNERYRFERARVELASFLRSAEAEVLDEEAKQKNRRDAAARRKEGPDPEVAQQKIDAERIRVARKRAAELSEKPELLPWPPSDAA